MQFYVRGLLFFILSVCSFTASSTSIFHSYVTDLSPPYICKLKLKSAKGVSLDTKHSYQFSGICSIKLPIGNTWIYQNVWVDTVASWNAETNEGFETTTLYNNQGAVVAQLKCDDDPWLTKAQCALVGYQNSTQFTNLGGVFNARTGQYPPFEILTGQYPPLARNQAIMQEAIALSILSATQEAAAAHTAFNQTFGNQTPIPAEFRKQTVKRKTRCFSKPKIGNIRLDACLKMNSSCGKPAADRFCQYMGYKQSISCRIDNARCTPTFIIGTQTVCNKSFCKGFDQVTCSN